MRQRLLMYLIDYPLHAGLFSCRARRASFSAAVYFTLYKVREASAPSSILGNAAQCLYDCFGGAGAQHYDPPPRSALGRVR